MQALYKLLLVDDEDEVRGRISSLINQNSGFIVVGNAGNGHDAYELVEDLKPDVVLTDIKMPFIDGIELARMLKRDFPTVKVAFISGYDEFKYAHEAIKLNVVSYLMKPLSSEDINLFLASLKKILDEEYSRKFNDDAAMKNYQDSLPLLINHLISSILNSKDQTKENIQKLKQLGMDIDQGTFISCLLEIDTDIDQEELLSLEKVRVLLDELFQINFSTYNLKYLLPIQNGIFIILKQRDTLIMKEVDAFLYELIQAAEQYLNIRIRVGISNLFNTFEQLAKSYQEAKEAIRYGKFLNTGRIVYLNEVEHKETHQISLDFDEIKSIENKIKFGSLDEVYAILDQKKMEIENQKNIVSIDLFLIGLASIMLDFAQSANLDLSKFVEGNLLKKLLSFSSTDEIIEWTKKVLFDLRNSLIESSLSRIERVLEDVIQYVDQNYENPLLSLNTVCDQFNISISYLSMLLKREKNVTFNKYVIEVRMEHAKELLTITSLKVVDIANRCGYNDVYYFSHSFKKYTGLSPKLFREGLYV
jgi:two-component system response regulator YesN